LKEDNPIHVFDWYFSDVSERDGARYHALADRPSETQQLISLISADSIIHFALWSDLPEGHPIRDLWSETSTDLLATIYLAYGGYFRQAFTALRSWFEIVIHGVYFADHYGQQSERYEQWRQGLRNAPINMGSIAASLASRTTSCGMHITKEAILTKLDSVYSFLSLHAHGRGLDKFDLQDGRDNVPRYLPKSFDLWIKSMFVTVDTAYFLYATFYLHEIRNYLGDSRLELERAIKLSQNIGNKLPHYVSIVCC
jgi:hypothetical protein